MVGGLGCRHPNNYVKPLYVCPIAMSRASVRPWPFSTDGNVIRGSLRGMTASLNTINRYNKNHSHVRDCASGSCLPLSENHLESRYQGGAYRTSISSCGIACWTIGWDPTPLSTKARPASHMKDIEYDSLGVDTELERSTLQARHPGRQVLLG